MSGVKSDGLQNRLNERQSNFELLRIIAMIAIAANHFVSHGVLESANNIPAVNLIWLMFLKTGGKIGVDIFVLISGYFSVFSQKSITKKAFRMWLQIFTYSAAAFVIFVLAGIQPFSIKEMLRHLFPITFSNWWFASTFFILLLLMPFINKFLTSLERKNYKRFLALTGICWCILPTFTSQNFQGNELLWFVFLYSAAAYIKLFDPFEKIKRSACFVLAFGLTIITFVSAIVLHYAGAESLQFYFYGMNKLNVFVISVLLLAGFSKLNVDRIKFINIIASATFGVYLIHDEAFIRTFLWGQVVKAADFSQSKFMIPYSLAAILLVFVCCTVIELARTYLLEKNYMKAVDRVAERFDSFTQKLSEKTIFRNQKQR